MQKLNLNTYPIFDDFNEDKNFHRILFNAGKSVQARELTQSQTILQSQIERLGKHMFTEGAMVVPGGIQSLNNQDYLKLELISGSLFSDFSTEKELFIKVNSNGLISKVAKCFDKENDDPVTLFVDFQTPGDNQEKEFKINDDVTIFVLNENGTHRNLALGKVSGKGKGSWVKVQNGIYFTRGMFVKTEDQQFVVSKYSNESTMKVGFQVIEEIITSDEDSSLYSNATGFPNENASGASRLKVTLKLVGIGIDEVDSDFIEIVRIEEGELTDKVDYTNYAIIEQSIARRNYETHGNYVIDNFSIDLKEHLKENDNGGLFSTENGGDEGKFIATMRPGIGYVEGYRVEKIGVTNLPIDKARDTDFLNNASFSADYGQYLLVNEVKSLPDVDIKKKLLLLDTGGTQIGTTRIRSIRKDTGTEYRLYVFDTKLNIGKLMSQVVSVKYTDSSSLFTAKLVSSSMFDASKNSLLFKLPVSAVKSLYRSGVGGDTSYTVLRTFNLTTNSSGVSSVSLGANEFFSPVTDNSYFIALTGSTGVGTIFNASSSVALGGTIAGTTMNIDLGTGQASKAIKVIAPVIKSQTTQKTKTLMTVTNEVINFPDTNQQKFTKADIYDIISVTDFDTDENITSQFTFDNGQRDGWYENGKLIKADKQIINRKIKVTYRHFNHSSGDYFSVDSYSGLERKDIPSYNGNNLSDYLDFRPLKDNSGEFSASNVTGENILPGSTVRSDITYYLPRNDSVYINADGNFGVQRGISSLTPISPSVPVGSMKLYDLNIPAYTLNLSDISVAKVDNRRYTMRDIGKLENRISNVEYYTTLSALERDATNIEVIDPITGSNRFKNGIAVDGFSDFFMCDQFDQDWSASVDLFNGGLHPSYTENGVYYNVGQMDNTVKPTDVIMASYTEEVAIDQPYATTTININPYAVFSWIGEVKLSPHSDFWVDTKYVAPKIVNNTVNLRGDAVAGTSWTAWTQTTEAEKNMIGGRHRDWHWRQRISYQEETTFRESNSTSTTDSSIGLEVIPYIRNKTIAVNLSGFRPYTRLYPFWDGLNITPLVNPHAQNYKSDGMQTLGSPVYTNEKGEAKCWIHIGPQATIDGSIHKFLTGVSTVKFSDSPTDSSAVGDVTTEGEAVYSSGGTLDIRQKTITNTKVLTATTVRTGKFNYLDPIAQTFIIPEDGMFISKIDVYFSTKANNIPVTMQLRTASSGMPSDSVIATVTIEPTKVNVSSDGTAATSFVFDDPVYLVNTMEYAIVLAADTQEYNVYIAAMGENIIGSEMALSKQAHMGVFLTSANGSTWSPDQTKDMKFRIHRAVFNKNPSSVIFDCQPPTELPLALNPIRTVTGSNQVKVYLKSHGLKVGDKVTLSDATGGNGINATSLNKEHTVLEVDIDNFTVSATNATATGNIGGEEITALVNYPFNIIHNNIGEFSPKGTSVSWDYRYVTQATRLKSEWFKIGMNDSYGLPSEGVVRGKTTGDLQIRATFNLSNDLVSPCIDSSGFVSILISPRVSLTDKVFNYVSRDIKFDIPTTHARFFVGAKLPGSAGMKVFVKLIQTPDQDVPATPWSEVTATNPVTNSERFMEYEYQINGDFIGYKIKVELTGANNNPPELSDIRTLAFA